ncbi:MULTISPECIES: TetR/AcrR family transcriptional regulator [Streptomyces]|uniref:TetR/AcrR family transcriptional regulator n=2 Tax=Streptomyces rochei group TaxID=2867164 RepID=A0AAX3ZBV5_STRRO|nr:MULTISPECIES: TetR/AcrR family transcriptional regulator [Streptomyces]MDV6290988.1 TetR/AcrR family transcriptional regulator [Streptomyces sp. UP1A-1]WDI16315.1 TetR/AcrR family transcriptional regulator [Streptomyces enissocaesilis]MBQ0882314.1 TetR/AcrR family transcriptional regulator [Streptomyces sp. RT42]MBQ0910960.1 TetR/AcrR family transcriptional regulator [Streptomyces sp. RM99]MBX4178026.1 TetR/AcrR family transcriptional regulator [Streptomyces geysiriensis]
MPTGVHLRDARQQLFDAAERVLLRDGPDALTSRAVTDEAGCAKGVLHRYFSDFDAFLTDLVLDRAAQLETQASALRESAGTGTVTDNLTTALTTLFGPVPVAVIPLITFRDELRARLRRATPGGGIAILAQVATAISAYLADERELGRIAADADIDSLTLSLVGGGHLLFADRDPGPPPTATVDKLVTTVLADVVQRRPR